MTATTAIGLDIGSTCIRALEVVCGRGHPVVSAFSQALLPEGSVVGGAVVDDKAVTMALRHLWSEGKFRTREVTVGITHQQVVVRETDVPNLPPKELRQALPFQVRDILPIPVESALLDFFPLGEPKRDGTVHGLLIAAPKDAVLALVRSVERAGLTVARVDLASFATLRAAAHLASDGEAVVDIGARATSIVIHVDGVPRIVRTVPRGSADVTALISTRLGISIPDAEMLKCRVGLRTDTDEVEASEVIVEAVRPLISEIRSSFTYVSGAESPVEVARLALVGGGSQLPGLTDTLSRQLGVPTFLADPLKRVREGQSGRHDSLERHRSSAAVSIGLTLGAM